MPDLAPFSPMYILPEELNLFGLPSPDVTSNVFEMVQLASSIIDIECGRIDGDGSGSLAYSTYYERILLQSRNRNLVMVSMKPVVAIDASTVAALTAKAQAQGPDLNTFYTGALANALRAASGELSGIIGASGRYGYTRQDMSIAYPDLFCFINPLNLVTMFGGPAPWVPIDVANTDYSRQTGEVWIPAGLQLQRYSEILIQYNSGYDPRRMPPGVKRVCASLVKRALASGGVTGLMNLSVAKMGANASFYQKWIDPVLDGMLQPYRVVRAY